MKKPLRLLAALLAVCVTASLFPPVGFAAGNTHSLPHNGDLNVLIAGDSVLDGDTIFLEGAGCVQDLGSNDTPWVINRSVTIEGRQAGEFSPSLSFQTGVIVLNADVTIRNLELTASSTVASAIVANGHTLTLENVTCYDRPVSLFCGTLTGCPASINIASGKQGEIIIQGNTSLKGGTNYSGQCGNIYAGNLYWGDNALTNNPEASLIPASISIPSTSIQTGSLGTVYACGATRLGGSEYESDPDSAPVRNTVTISGNVPDVRGAGANTVTVQYSGSGSEAVRAFTDISALEVRAGHLALSAGSTLQDVSVNDGARLSLVNLTNPEFQDFTGGGYLILGKDQTLNIVGAVSGTSKVAVGSVGYDASLGGDYCGVAPVPDHPYIQAPRSVSTSFELLRTNTPLPFTLEYASGGTWTAVSGSAGGEDEKVSGFAFQDPETIVDAEAIGQDEAEMPLNVMRVGTGTPVDLSAISLNITVNGKIAPPVWSDDFGYYIYTADKLKDIAVVNDIFYATPTAEGTYNISITLPGQYTQSGQPLTASAKLTVGTPGPVSIPIPQAVPGLKWTGSPLTGVEPGEGYTLTGNTATDVGSYTATATLEPGYQWDGGSQDAKTIDWSIRRADGPDAPGGLTGTAPTSAGGSDGKISGVSAAMEYANNPDFKNATPCTGGEITGLAAGTYYVRVAQTATHEAGKAAPVVVPPYGVTAESITISSNGHKTAYRVGEPLDVTGLTIDVLYSNQTIATVPVTGDMVSGFNSSAATASQTLTIRYGTLTATYDISITEAVKYQVTVNNSHAADTGAGSYEKGQTVTVHAGVRVGYTFTSWEQNGVTLEDPTNPDATFRMPGNNVTLLAGWEDNSTAGHDHSWSGAWSNNSAYHWHSCTVAGCPQRSGYAAHTPGGWVVDQAATATQSGSRHRSCTVCGYVTERGTLPATGGGSSSSSDDSRPSDSFFGTNSGGGGGSSSNTVKNADGSATTVSTNKGTGAVTETTKWPDGSRRAVETKPDGTVTTTEQAADGSVTKTVEKPDGSWEATVKQAGGLTASVRRDRDGASADVRIPAKAEGNVALPIPELPLPATLAIRAEGAHTVEIPTGSSAPGTVAFLVRPDGSETLVKTAVLTGNRMTVPLTGSATVALRDNHKNFTDTRNHWAENAIDFVSARELFSGRTSAAFAPDVPMTRAMLMTVLARLDGVEAAGSGAYDRGMAWAVSKGVSDGSSPGAPITREQLAAMLHRYAGSPAATNRELHFTDAGSVSAYAAEAVRWASENGILGGYRDGSLNPGGQATRAQVATMLMRYVRDWNP